MKNMPDLTAYMSEAIAGLFRSAVKASVSNPREASFFVRFAADAEKAAEKRRKYENAGTHIPAFLIASITSRCNLGCRGCYARANRICGAGLEKDQLSAGRWGAVFREAQTAGVGFILLAGGEPLMRRDVVEQAAKVRSVVFPLFTNGTMLDGQAVGFFDRNRHILPVLSIEGGRDETDARRGAGTYDRLAGAMERMREKGVYYGVSITVTTENLKIVASDGFIGGLAEQGCKFVIFVEYVPVAAGSERLAPTDRERNCLAERQERLRRRFEGMIFLSFPGDEKALGGCLAGGRGFFHINPAGEAEPCPFSPHSDVSLADTSLLGALQSPLFDKLRRSGLLGGEHSGGCTLFEHREEVEKLAEADGSGE